MTAERLAPIWARAWAMLGVAPPPGLLEQILERYGEPGRAYHSLQHLSECFDLLLEVEAEAPVDHSAEVRLALFFHDAIYDTTAKDNEERSAEWARQALMAGGVREDAAARVAAHVLATRHDAAPKTDDARLVVDVDLGILGASEARFAEYARQIREEYAWVPDDAFRAARAAVLSGFLERPAIFTTRAVARRREAPARRNLERATRTARPPSTP